MKTQNLILAALAVFAPATSAQAAAITWTDGTFKTDAILPTHYVQYAVGFGDSSAVTTANGVTFGADNGSNATFNATQTYASYLSGGGSTGDSGFNTVLTNGDWGGDGTLTLNHLHVGSQYQVLLLVDDTRGNVRSGTVSDSVADGSHSSSNLNWGFTGGTPEIGGYYKGTFTANATSQTIIVSNTGGNQIDGIVLSTPEPSTFVLAGLGALGLLFAARRRRLKTVLACCLVLVGLTQGASATPVDVLLSSSGGVADINGVSGPGSGGFGTVAANLNDGNTDGIYADGSVAHSTGGMQLTNFVPYYMEVTIPQAQRLGTVEVFNRLDGEQGRIDGSGTVPYTLTIYNGTPGPGTVTFTENLLFTPAASLTGPNELGQIITLPIGGIMGDVVRITQNNNDYMNLAELKAFTPEPSSFVLGGLGAVGLLFAARRRRLQTVLACCLAVFGLTQAASAATITWGAPTAISGPSNVVTGMHLVDSIMFANTNANLSETVNGVTFDRAVTAAGNPIPQNSAAGRITTFEDASQASSAPATGNTAYDALLSRESYTNPGSVYTIDVTGLSVGDKYAIQAWTDDFDHGTSQNGLNLNYGQANAAFAQSGNYIVGTFIADATSQTLTWGSGAANVWNTMDALQVQQLTPEPSSFVLGGLAVVGMLVAARRRRKV